MKSSAFHNLFWSEIPELLSHSGQRLGKCDLTEDINLYKQQSLKWQKSYSEELLKMPKLLLKKHT